MELLVERTFAIFIAISGPILTIFDLPGNTLLLLTSLMFAFFDEVLYFNGRLLSAMVLIYALGEFWEFCVGLFGIKRSKVSWFAVIFIALGSFAGTLLGTLIFPILGSLLGGMAGAFAAAFAYELAHTGVSADAVGVDGSEDALFCNGRQAGSRYCFSCSALEAGSVFLNI